MNKFSKGDVVKTISGKKYVVIEHVPILGSWISNIFGLLIFPIVLKDCYSLKPVKVDQKWPAAFTYKKALFLRKS